MSQEKGTDDTPDLTFGTPAQEALKAFAWQKYQEKKREKEMGEIMGEIVFMGVVGDKPPYGTCGRVINQTKTDTKVDFGPLGLWWVRSSWLRRDKPDPAFPKAAKQALGVMARLSNREVEPWIRSVSIRRP